MRANIAHISVDDDYTSFAQSGYLLANAEFFDWSIDPDDLFDAIEDADVYRLDHGWHVVPGDGAFFNVVQKTDMNSDLRESLEAAAQEPVAAPIGC